VTPKNDAVPEQQLAPWLDVVEKQVQQLRFGVVQIVVHDSRVVQIERTEKVRLAPSSDSRPGR
jgi:hypothetical protein